MSYSYYHVNTIHGHTFSFSVTITVSFNEMQTTSTPMYVKGQGHLVTLVKDHLSLIVSMSFFLENTRPIKIIFPMKALWDGIMTFYANGLDHMTKMTTMPIYAKNLKKSSSVEPLG